MAFDVQAARAAGYSQEEINAYLQGQPKTEKIAPVAPGQEVDPGEPPPPEGTITPAGEGSMMPGLATAGLAAAGAAVPLGVGIGIGKYGGRAMDMARNFMGAPAQVPVTGMPNPTAVNLGGAVPQQIQVPPASGTRSPAMQSQMQNLRTAPVQAPPPVAAQPAPQMQAAKSIVQKLALDKVMQSAGGMLKGSVGPGMAMYSGGLNTNEAEELRRRQAMPNPYAR
jgi:hypothetical protein